MKAAQIEARAHALMQAHGLGNWQFRLDHARNRLGSCDYQRRCLTLSRHLCDQSAEVIEDTLLHEIAHALVGPGHGHDAVWQAMARRLGARPRATTAERVMPAPRWHLMCSGCGQVVAQRHRRRLQLARLACAVCGPGGGALYWRDTGGPPA